MRAACVCLAMMVLVSARAALAAPVTTSPADREAARTLAKRGYELFEQHDYKASIESFRKAEEHFHAPPHWLYIARAQAKLGALLAAKGSYEHILAEKLAPDAPQPFKEAQASARTELEDIEPRIPSLYITLAGTAAARATVTVDGAPVAREELGQAIPTDPGLHTVIAAAPGVPRVERAVLAKEGSNVERVALVIDVPSSPSVVPPVLSFTIGGLALAAGGVTLGLALTNKGQTAQDKALMKNLEIASVASFVGGGLGVGLGITLVALRPSRKAAAAAGASAPLRARIGPTSIAIEGAF